MNPRLFLIVLGFLLDVVGFLIAFTSYFQVPLPGWQVGLLILVVGIVMDAVGFLA
jgi:putative effector of murein hydrolase LrgA (UPF0299 family)